MVHLIGENRERIPSVYKALRTLDEKWGRLEHRLVRVHHGEYAWTCPAMKCRKDHVYDQDSDFVSMILGMDECCQAALRQQFPPSKEWWDVIWRRVDLQREGLSDGGDTSEESVRPG